MDDIAALGAAGNEFAQRLDLVASDQWNAPTECGDWTVAMLVDHVTVGNRMADLLLHGADAKTSVGPQARTPDGVAPVAAYAESSAAQLAAFNEPDAMSRTVDHPALAMPGETLAMFRALDLALHAWDLATAIGADLMLDPDLCTSLWTRLEPYAPFLEGTGMFGPPKGTLDSSASPQASLLHHTGR